MSEIFIFNGDLLLETKPSAPATPLSISRTDVGIPNNKALAEISMLGSGLNNLQGAIVLKTMNSGSVTGTLDERMRVHANGNVGIGTATPIARLQVTGGAIMPAAGNTEAAGLLFPKDPGGGAGDAAWIRYYPRTGESTTLEIGISNDADDHIALMPSGNVGIGTATPINRLDINGDVAISGKHALRGSDAWLRLNQDNAFPNGVHTPGNFAPSSLNVGGVNGWGNPGGGNMWLAGDLQMQPGRTLSCSGRLHISGEEILYLLNKSGVIVSKAWGGTGELTVEGAFIRVSGAGGEQAYLGGDGVGNDVQLGSFRGDVMGIAMWNAASGWMDVHRRNCVAHSDARSKTNIESIPEALEKVLRLRGVLFDWKADTPSGQGEAGAPRHKHLGFIAQEVVDIVPSAVTETRGGLLGVAYEAISPLLVEAIKQQQSRIEVLEARLERMQQTLLETHGNESS